MSRFFDDKVLSDDQICEETCCDNGQVSPESRYNDYRNRLPFHYIEDGENDGYYYWTYGATMELSIILSDDVACGEDLQPTCEIVVDDKLSETSKNPVQNKVITEALDGKLNKSTEETVLDQAYIKTAAGDNSKRDISIEQLPLTLVERDIQGHVMTSEADSEGQAVPYEQFKQLEKEQDQKWEDFNLENGSGDYSLRQKYFVNGVDYSATASGVNAVALGGKRYDKLDDTSRTPTSADGNQSFAAGGSNHTYGDWDIAMGADNTTYQRNAISLGKENQSGMTFEEYQALHPNATEDEWKKVYAWTTAIGVTNKILGQGAVGLGNSNEVYDHAGIGIGHTNKVRGAFSAGIGRNNKINHNLAYALGDGNSTEFQSILIGWNNTSKSDYDVFIGRNNSIKGTVIGDGNTGDGSGTVIGDGNTLNGSEDYIIGKNNTTDGSKQSITFGHDNISQSGYGVTFGAYNTNKGNYNLVGGGGVGRGTNNVISNIQNSIMYGAGLNKAGGSPSAIFGQFNTKNRIETILEIGNGTSDSDRSNAFEVLKDGRAKVYTAPRENNDVVRKTELDATNTSLESEVIRAKQEESKIDSKLDAEITRAKGVESTLTTTINSHINNKENPHSVTKSQVGLGDVDNTADKDKPISTAQQSALDTKLDKPTITDSNNHVVIYNGTKSSSLNYDTDSTINTLLLRDADGRSQVADGASGKDIVNYSQLDKKYDKAGGTIGGNVVITGDLTVNGTEHINNTENLAVENAMIYSNAKGATLAQLGGIGIKTNATDIYGIVYDPVADSVKLGLGKSDANGKFTFNANEGEPVAVRDDSSKLTNDHIIKWDSVNHKLVDSGKTIDDFVNLTDEQTIGGKKTFADETHFNGVTEHYGNVNITDYVLKVLDTNKDFVTQYSADGIVTENGDKTYTRTLPLKSGTIALTSDIEALNIQNGDGVNSLIQKYPDGKPNTAKADGTIVFGQNSTAHQKFDIAIGGVAIAGFAYKSDFEAFYYDFENNKPLHEGQGLNAQGEVLDFTGNTYENSFGWNRSFGEGSIANGRSAVAFQAGQSNGLRATSFGTSGAKGTNAFAIGEQTGALGDDTFTQGTSTVANYYDQAAFGRFNDNKEENIFEVGIGSGEPSGEFGLPETKNGFAVLRDGRAKVLTAPQESDDVVRNEDLVTTPITETETVVVDTTTVNFALDTEHDTGMYVSAENAISLGSTQLQWTGGRDKYKVIWDGVEYIVYGQVSTVTRLSDDGAPTGFYEWQLLGNGSNSKLMMYNKDTADLPFAITQDRWKNSAEWLIYATTSTAATHTIKVIKLTGTYNKVTPEYQYGYISMLNQSKDRMVVYGENAVTNNVGNGIIAGNGNTVIADADSKGFIGDILGSGNYVNITSTNGKSNFANIRGAFNALYSSNDTIAPFISGDSNIITNNGEQLIVPFIGGYQNSITNNGANWLNPFVTGYHNKITANKGTIHPDVIFGSSHNITYDGNTTYGLNLVAGNGHTVKNVALSLIAGLANTVECLTADVYIGGNIVGGTSNTVNHSRVIIGGQGNKTDIGSQFIAGKYSAANEHALVKIGNGTSDTARANAFEVLDDNRAKVYGEPTENNDVLRYQDIAIEVETALLGA